MLTAETVTDVQLRALQTKAAKDVANSSPYHLVFPLRQRPGVELLYAATYALGEERDWLVGYEIKLPDGADKAEYVAEGRRYCAEFLNLTTEQAPCR